MEAPVYEKICGVAAMIGGDENLISSDMAGVRIISNDEAERASVYIRDFARILSEMAKKSAEVQRVNAAAAKAAQHRSDFLANVSHEMRTPLNAILGMTEMALHKDMSQDAKEYVHQIRSSGRHLLTIINDILDYSNLDSGDMPIVEVKYEPLSLVNDVAAMGLCDGFTRDESADDAELSFTALEAHILIVDDNMINLSVAKGVIEPLGMQVDTAGSAQEAIDMVRNCRYDIVFMDHMMPEIDGIEATHIIRSQFPSYADVPIIALTANVSGGARDMFLKEGLNDFIAKPIELRDMINKIRRWLSEEKIVPISNQSPAARKV